MLYVCCKEIGQIIVLYARVSDQLSVANTPVSPQSVTTSRPRRMLSRLRLHRRSPPSHLAIGYDEINSVGETYSDNQHGEENIDEVNKLQMFYYPR